MRQLTHHLTIKLFAVFTFIFAFIITTHTPMMWEDVVYTLKADPALGMAMSNTAVSDTIHLGRYDRVATLSDLAESTYNHYMNANGRLFPHLTSQVFGTFIGKGWFNLLNAAMFVILALITTLITVGPRKTFWPWAVIVFSCLWFFMPESNTGFFLMTYALNYLWSSVFSICFLYLYLNQHTDRLSHWKFVLGCLFAFGAGWSHEGLAIGIAGALVIDNLLDYYHHHLKPRTLIWCICFCLGAFFLCIAPGNFTRTDESIPLYLRLLSFTRLRLFWLFILSWLLFNRRISFIRDNSLLLTALVIQMTFLFYVGYRNPRVLWGPELFSLILLIKVFAYQETNGKPLTKFAYILLPLLVVHLGWLIYRSGEIRQQYDNIIALYENSQTGDVFYDILPETDLTRDFIPTPFCYYRPFELTAFSVYYTKEQKSMHVYPTAMQHLCSDTTAIFYSPYICYLAGKNLNRATIQFGRHNSVNPQYSSYLTAIKNLFGPPDQTVKEEVTFNTHLQGYDIAELPQQFDGQIHSVKIISTQSWKKEND